MTLATQRLDQMADIMGVLVGIVIKAAVKGFQGGWLTAVRKVCPRQALQ